MMSEQEQEKKNQRVAFFSTLGIQVVLFLLLFVMVAYRPPNPPNPQVGIELNLGFDDQGGGDNPATTPVGDEGNQPEETQDQPEEVNQEEVKEVIAEEVKPTDTKPTEEVVSTKTESPVSVKEKKEEVKPVEKPKEKVEEKKPEVKPEKPKAVYTPTENKTTGTKEGKEGSEGTDEGKTGNKGKPEGTLVKGGQYTGNPGGGGGGPSLELSGWAWDQKPNPNVPNNESGRIVFEIKVDDSGEIVKITRLESTLSPEAEQICRQAIQKLTFIQTGENVPAISTGKITFVVRSK